MKNETHARLEVMLERITEELAAVGIHNPDNPADWIAVPEGHSAEADDNLSADVVESWNERAGLVSALERQYNDITRALRAYDAGTYGMCEICNTKISDARLSANPIARTCEEHINDESILS